MQVNHELCYSAIARRSETGGGCMACVCAYLGEPPCFGSFIPPPCLVVDLP